MQSPAWFPLKGAIYSNNDNNSGISLAADAILPSDGIDYCLYATLRTADGMYLDRGYTYIHTSSGYDVTVISDLDDNVAAGSAVGVTAEVTYHGGENLLKDADAAGFESSTHFTEVFYSEAQYPITTTWDNMYNPFGKDYEYCLSYSGQDDLPAVVTYNEAVSLEKGSYGFSVLSCGEYSEVILQVLDTDGDVLGQMLSLQT